MIEERAKQILEDFSIYKELPASISRKHHIGETLSLHLDLAVNVMNHLCDEFNIQGEDKDMLIGATWLHDIGRCAISQKGKVEEAGWKYYEATGYSRIKSLMKIHGSIGRAILDDYDIPRKKEIQRLISVHMSHWYELEPQPENLYEYLICIADYVESRGVDILKYKEHK